ncbi:hypothetical protein [Leptothoe spongobia]|uniref:Uncharacterized protein n=1 Tax=Leptothoe spongobia TAU-MAC 1115 TaxID=1967444 RepID=A0A947DCK6_9CYAN|nr:hypothetical protein [Leptothoe spongobia]MBT9314542.1 hypothetical protein [Leptothoe spongobia TAU-MAC 1115]
MVIRFRRDTILARLLQQLHDLNSQQPMRPYRRRPYSAIAQLAFSMFRWLFLFFMGIAILVLFAAFTISNNFAEAIFMGVMPVIRLFGGTTFFVFALACLKESI